jgi:hypothetical protein
MIFSDITLFWSKIFDSHQLFDHGQSFALYSKFLIILRCFIILFPANSEYFHYFAFQF